MKPLEKVFWDEIAEMLHVEELLLKSLPKMRDAATSETLKTTLESYRVAAQGQAQRIREVFDSFDLPKREKKCDAMMGLLVKGQQMMQRSGSSATLDAALVSLSRRINGYKVVSYQSVAAWAKLFKQKEIAKGLEKTAKAEQEAGAEFDGLTIEMNASAAEQMEDSVRPPVARPKRPKELVEGARWGEW
ncbi:MAG TPA: DUF892 family protein [Verrucomicrobiae bacterium]|nr:DUF892 family protein [Verrucomicrobiae bacterium]